ncbi:hypothetical protein ACU8KH_02600 [Lachancea thermotolerans]
MSALVPIVCLVGEFAERHSSRRKSHKSLQFKEHDDSCGVYQIPQSKR